MANIESLDFNVILKDQEFKKRIGEDIALAKKMNSSLTSILNLRKQINASYSAAATGAKAEAAAAAKTAKEFGKAKAAMDSSAASINGKNGLMRGWLRFTATMWSVISVVRIFTRAIGSAIKEIVRFQQANANLATIMQVSRKEIKVLTEDALMLGRTTEWTAMQVTELQTALAKLGYNIPQIRNMQESVLQFATSVGANLPDAANLAGAALRMFGMHSSQMQKALEILAASTNKTALDFEKLKVALPYAGSIANAIGFDVAETASLLGVLSNAGLSSSRVGTGLRQILLELSKQNSKLQAAMGGNIKTFDDFVRGLQLLRDRGLQAGEAAKLVSTRASGALLVLANGVDDIKRLNDEVRDTDGLLKKIQAERLDTVQGSALLLNSAWKGLIQTFRDSTGPMKSVVDWLTKIVNAMSLAASRANRVAQGTKDVIGSDDLTKQFKDQYEGIINSLVAGGMNPVEAAAKAAKTVNEAMQKWMDKAVAANTNPDIDEKGWYKFLTNSVPLVKWITKGVTRKGRAADEQVEAIENTMVSVTDYMENHAKESAEIAANNYLDQWRLIFDTKGAEAARSAADAVIKSFDGDADMKKRLTDMQVHLDEYINSGGAGGASGRGEATQTEAERQRKERISDLNRYAQYLRRVADAYAKLEPYFGEGTQKKMEDIFGKGNYSLEDIERRVLNIISELETLGGEGSDAAENIQNSWNLDEVSRIIKKAKEAEDALKEAEKAQKALDDYNRTYRKLAGKDFLLSGTGIEYDVRKIISDFNTTRSGINDKYLDAENEARKAHKGNANAIAEEVKKLRDLAAEETKYAEAVRDEKLRSLAKKIFDEQMSGFNLTDWGEKTIDQIDEIRNALLSLDVPDNIKALLTDEQLSDLQKLLKELGKGMVDKTVDPEKAQKYARGIKSGASYLSKAADAMRELADATDNADLRGLATALSNVGQTVGAMADGFLSGGLKGMAVAGVLTVIEQIVSAFAKVEEEATRVRKAIREMQIEATSEEFRAAFTNGSSSIFGENFIKQLRDASSGLDELRKRIRGFKKDLDEWKDVMIRKYFGNSLGWGANPGSKDSVQKFKDSINDFEDMFVILDKKAMSLRDAAEMLGMRLYDEFDNISADFLSKIIELVGDKDDTGLLKKLKLYAEDYAETVKQVEAVVEEVVGNIASSAADSIVDSWIEAGKAALDYADILDDVARSYAKMLVKSMIMETALDPITEDLKRAFLEGRYDDAMEMISHAMENVSQSAPMFENILKAFDPFFKKSESETGSVGKGIQSITEDTANLLASYLNAIRADVAGIRAQDASGWENVSAVREYVPTLDDWLSKIQADTANIAQSNADMLAEIRSVIGQGDDGSAIKVLM